MERWEDVVWEYPLLETAMEEAGFKEMGSYVLNRQNMVAQYIAMQPILYLYKKTVRRLGDWVARRSWKQEGLELAVTRTVVMAAADREEGKEGE